METRVIALAFCNNDTREPSSKGKTPWIEINGQGVADSSFIIEYLNEKYAVDLNMTLTPAEKGIGRAFCKMVDEHLYWIMIMSRWYHDVYDVEPVGLGIIPYWMLPLLARKVFKHGWAQGVGRHSREENNHLMYGDLKAISDYLGEKKYLFGDKPCEVDCVVFGQLAEFCWHMPNLYGEKLVNETFPNLRNYCFRMKKAFWPDLGTGAMSKKQKQSGL